MWMNSFHEFFQTLVSTYLRHMPFTMSNFGVSRIRSTVSKEFFPWHKRINIFDVLVKRDTEICSNLPAFDILHQLSFKVSVLL